MVTEQSTSISPSLVLTGVGLYCPQGDFYIDPRRRVTRALITHSHSDHARPGSTQYLTARANHELLALRTDNDAQIESLEYGKTQRINEVEVSFYPSGHILGAAQIRLNFRGHTTVVTGDYKTQPDATCQGFESVPCHTFISESTFALPIYHWRPEQEVFSEINEWWRTNQQNNQTSVLTAYALGKAQRLLAGVDSEIGPIVVHPTVQKFIATFSKSGVSFPPALDGSLATGKEVSGRALVIVPPSVLGSPWLAKYSPYRSAFASGWMAVRGMRRRRNVDRGFILSDHADWNGLLSAIASSRAEKVWLTHGHTDALCRYLQESGTDAESLPHLDYRTSTLSDREEGDE